MYRNAYHSHLNLKFLVLLELVTFLRQKKNTHWSSLLRLPPCFLHNLKRCLLKVRALSGIMIKACKYEWWDRPSSSYLAWPTVCACVCVCVFFLCMHFAKQKCLTTSSLSSRLVRFYYNLLRFLNSNLFEMSCLTCKQ